MPPDADAIHRRRRRRRPSSPIPIPPRSGNDEAGEAGGGVRPSRRGGRTGRPGAEGVVDGVWDEANDVGGCLGVTSGGGAGGGTDEVPAGGRGIPSAARH